MDASHPISVTELLALRPMFHEMGDGTSTSWALDEASLKQIDERLEPGLRTLETGAGVSTVLFALRGCHHICITPDRAEVAQIRRFCDEQHIDLSRVQFLVDSSCRALPTLRQPIDLALVDGGHGFPTPFVDWYYIAGLLMVGGRLFIDDIQLWTGDVIVNFMRQQPEWEYTGTVGAKTAEFQKVAEGSESKEWEDQPFVMKKSRPLILSMRLRRAGSLMAEGRFSEIWRRSSKLMLDTRADGP